MILYTYQRMRSQGTSWAGPRLIFFTFNPIDNLLIWESLSLTIWREALKVLNDPVETEDKLTYIGVSGLKKAPT